MIKIRYAVRVLSLAAFIALTLTGKVQLWMALFLAGAAASTFSGRWYCGWVCPMNTVMKLAGKRSKNGFFGKKASLPAWVRLLPLAAFVLLFIGVKRFGLQANPLVILTALSLPFALLAGERLWHDRICPFGTIFSFTARPAPFSIRIDEDSCTGCGICERTCPSREAIVRTGQRTPAARAVVQEHCLTCFACVDACPAGAIHYERKGEKHGR